ncbi:2091_t:CDS:2 [Gigaspora margarita]|uniref:2091_t:CDS:1 n=1 Tax=Gigaspora margarita TaxID=4874 RepID=A0ABN7VH70_GIGMA|nr:2091_t:CDS:2 [Gigaspora margarita]
MKLGPTPMKIDKAKVSSNSGSTKKNNRKKLMPELKENYKRKELCFKCERKGYIAHNYYSKGNKNGNKANIASTSPKINRNEAIVEMKVNREALLKADGQVQGQNTLILIDLEALKDLLTINLAQLS